MAWRSLASVPENWTGDVDCVREWQNWEPLRNVLGEDDVQDDSPSWARRVGLDIDYMASWMQIKAKLQNVRRYVPAAVASSCLALRVMGQVIRSLVEQPDQRIQWGPLEVLAASRFPIFHALCAASTPDDLAASVLQPHALQDETWAEGIASKVVTALQAAVPDTKPGVEGAAWVVCFILSLMGLRSDGEEALNRSQQILESHSVRQLLPSSFFCVLHALKMWRLRAPVPRHVLQIKQSLPGAVTDLVLVTAAWGRAVRTLSRWMQRAASFDLLTVIYCLSDSALHVCQKNGGGYCVEGPPPQDVHGFEKYEIMLAVAATGRTAVWVDLDSYFLSDPRDALEAVTEIGVVRHARAACVNGGLIVLHPRGIPVVQQLVSWLHIFAFGMEQNGLNALVRGTSFPPRLTGRFRSPLLLDPVLFTTVDGVTSNPIWVHWPTPINMELWSLESFFEEAADSGQLSRLLPLLRRAEPMEDLLDCCIVHVALKAPMLVRFVVSASNYFEDRGGLAGFQQREHIQEAKWQTQVYLAAGWAYEAGYVVREDIHQAIEMYRRASARGSKEASQALIRLDPTRSILQLL